MAIEILDFVGMAGFSNLHLRNNTDLDLDTKLLEMANLAKLDKRFYSICLFVSHEQKRVYFVYYVTVRRVMELKVPVHDFSGYFL